MEKLKKEILEQVEESKRPAVKKLLNTLELEAAEEYKKSKFKGRDKKYHIDNETKGILEKYINRELKTKEVLLVLGISKASFFRMLKEYKGPQVEEPKEIIKKQQEENQQENIYKKSESLKENIELEEVKPREILKELKECKICGIDKPMSAYSIAKRNKAGEPIYRAECKECFNKKQNKKNKA